ncbi:MAG: tetraacyldisaccharide 4'-kinase [Thermoanaerobaculia bacterium]
MSPLGALLSLRRRGYESGWLRSAAAPVPAVSIGNMTWGGTGKTPFTIWLAQRLEESGKRVGVVSRGYGRRSKGLRVVSDGKRGRIGVEEAGDEPTMIAGRLPEAIVVVAENRVEGAQKAAALGAEILLLDDAFQHLALRRDFDIVLLDSAAPLQGGLPPAGRAREPASALSRADLFVVTGGAREGTAGAESLVGRWNPNAPVFHSQARFAGWFDEHGEPVPADRVAGAASIAVASIAAPRRFLRTLEDAGAFPSEALRFRDHHFYSESDLRRIERAFRRAGAALLFTTEKDLPKLAGRTRLPLVAARIEPEVLEPGLPERVGAVLSERGHVV